MVFTAAVAYASTDGTASAQEVLAAQGETCQGVAGAWRARWCTAVGCDYVLFTYVSLLYLGVLSAVPLCQATRALCAV